MAVQSQFIEMFGSSISNTHRVSEYFGLKAGKSISAEDINTTNEEDLYPCYGGNGLRGFVKDFTHDGEFVLIGRQGALCGNVQLASGKFYATEHAVVVTPKQRTNPIWLFFAFSAMNLNQYARGVAQPGLAVSQLEQLAFQMPELVEQEVFSRIAVQADKSKFDGLKSQFIEMFSGREYPQLPIRDFADITTGSTPSKSHPEYWGGSNPWVSAEDMKDKYVYDTVEKVTDKGYATCKHIPVNTLMYVCRGSIGVMAINKVECSTNQSICTATCKADKCEVEFLYHSLLYKKDEIKQIGIGTNFKSLNQTTFSNLRIFLPPIEEQRRFVSITTQADKSKYLS